MHNKIGFVGGTGFVGRHLICELSRHEYRLVALSRRRERHRELLVFPRLELRECNVHDEGRLSEGLAGCDAVVSLAGVLNEYGGARESFEAVHAQLPAKIVRACRENGIERLLHLSALNASPDAPSEYLRTKAKGEAAVLESGLAVTVFRPSVIFGRDDSFFNRFATLLKISPGFFPLACPNAKFAPVYVENVVAAMARCLEDKSTHGQVYELCGPRQYTLMELVTYTARTAGLRRKIIGLNDSLAWVQARVLEHLPGKPLSTDNLLSMRIDSLCRSDGLAALGLEPISVESVVPAYVGGQDRNARYQQFRTSARRT